MKHLMRTVCFMLSMLMLAAPLAACRPGTDPGGDTGTTNASTDRQTDTEPETKPDDDPLSGLLKLSGDGLQGQIVLPLEPALWETAAAEELQARLAALSGITLPIQNGEPAPGAVEILIGPTTREESRAVDPAALGTAGYALTVQNDKLVVYAASGDGMRNALNALFDKAVQPDGNAVCVSKTLNVTEKADADEPVPVKQLSGEWGPSVVYANTVANDLNGAFTDGTRKGYRIQNASMELLYDLASTEGQKLVTGMYNENGVPFFTNGMDVFVTTKDAHCYVASQSNHAARVNVYRLGYYYREIHIMDQNFTPGEATFDPEKSLTLLKKKAHWAPYMTSEVAVDPETYALSYTVTDKTDPYITLSVSIDTKKYNALHIVLKCDAAQSGEVYIANGKGFNSAQNVSFQIEPGTGFNSYVIPLNTIPDYTAAKMTALRLDIGAANGELVEISTLEAVHIDSDAPTINLDRVFHTYADKLHEQLHFVCVGDVDDLHDFGMRTALDASRVKGLCLIDANGCHDSLDGVDIDTLYAAAFDMDRAGVVGWILPDGIDGQMNVHTEDGAYVVTVTQYVPEDKTFKQGDGFSMGYRVYTSAAHSFDDFMSEAYIERNPIVIAVADHTDNAQAVGYDPLRGCYLFTVGGASFTPAYKNPQKQYKVNAELQNDGYARKLYVMTEENVGCLENAVILDDSGSLLPISPEVCKNFRGENEEPLYDAGDREYGDSFFPLVLEAGEVRDFTVIHLYQNWGVFPLKQLSSIQFIAPYYHLSCGVTETNCIAPYYVYGKDYWTLPDFRAMSAPLWSSQPQHTSVGRLYWLQYTDSEGKKYGSDFVEDTIDSSGPVYADLWSDYLSDDGRIAVSYRHLETPQTDENRTYYEVDMTVLEDVTINDFKNDFSFFSFDGRSIAFSRMGYVDESGNELVLDVEQSDHSDIICLGHDSPYFDYWKSTGDYVCFALLIKNAEITIGGQKIDPGFVIKEQWTDDLNLCALSLDLGKVTLKAGDHIHINMILMPWGSQLSKDDHNVSDVRVDSCLYPLVTTVKVGTLIPDNYMPKIMADQDTAEFTVTDGGGRMAVRVYGLSGWNAPTLEEYVNGQWVPYVTNHYDYDGYMVYYEHDGTYSVSFIIETGTGVERTFRVTGN